MYTIVAARPLSGSVVQVRFATGEEGAFDVRPFAERSAFFRQLLDPAYFRQVRVVAGTISWPNGHDFDPGTVYARSVREAAASA